MDDTTKTPTKEQVHSYTILESAVFTNDRGFALAENPNAVQPFVTWQFTEENGQRDYYWGHYFSDGEKARSDLADRIRDHKEQYGVAEKPTRSAEKSSIKDRMFEAEKQVKAQSTKPPAASHDNTR